MWSLSNGIERSKIQMNYMVIAVLVILGFGLIRGYVKGIIGELITVIALVLSVIGLAILMMVINKSLDREFGDAIMAGMFLLVFIILIQVIKVILTAVKIFSKLPVINGLNKLLGTILGIVEGLILVWVGFIIITRYDIFGKSSEMISLINENTYTMYLYKFNLLTKIF